MIFSCIILRTGLFFNWPWDGGYFQGTCQSNMNRVPGWWGGLLGVCVKGVYWGAGGYEDGVWTSRLFLRWYLVLYL